MKGVLEYSLPEEQNEFELAAKASRLSSVIFELDNDVLRKMTKYGSHPTEERELTEQEQALAQEIRTKLWQIINEAGLGELIS